MNNRWRRIAKHVDKNQIIIMYGGGLGYPEIMISGIGTVSYHDCNFHKTPGFRKGSRKIMEASEGNG